MAHQDASTQFLAQLLELVGGHYQEISQARGHGFRCRLAGEQQLFGKILLETRPFSRGRR